MPVRVFHGELEAESSRELGRVLDVYRKDGVQIISLDGKKLTAAELTDALEQDDFFGGKRVVVVKNLFARPKSKARDALAAMMAASDLEVLVWEGKKLTAATLKLLGAPEVFTTASKSAIWELVAALAPDNNNQRFIEIYEKVVAQNRGETDPGIYITATLLWQVQQLIDIKYDNYHGTPFGRTRAQNQAKKFTLPQLLTLHQRLVDFDWRAKTGQLQLPVFEQLLWELLH